MKHLLKRFIVLHVKIFQWADFINDELSPQIKKVTNNEIIYLVDFSQHEVSNKRLNRRVKNHLYLLATKLEKRYTKNTRFINSNQWTTKYKSIQKISQIRNWLKSRYLSSQGKCNWIYIIATQIKR